MTRLMYDSTNITDIPQSAAIVGFYTDGIYAASLVGVRARFPNAVLVGISAIGTNSGVVGDIEPGCMTINQGVAWVKMRRAAGVDPTIYCNETNAWSSVRAAFRNQGTPEPHYWCANYDGVAVLRSGQVARQYANPTLTKHHYDLSVVADFWPGVDGLQSGGSGSLIGEDLDARQNQLLIVGVSQFVDIAETVGPPPIPTKLAAILKAITDGNAAALKAITDGNAAIVAAIKALPAASGGEGGLTAAQATQLNAIASDLGAVRMRVERDLAP